VLSTAALLLAATVSVGRLPIPDCVKRFPDPSYWPGIGAQQVGNMLAAIRDDAATELRTSGPGPQQLAARWKAGGLTPQERVLVLLAGATYHDPALLPAIADGLRSAEFRERQAATVGLAWLWGLGLPDPTALADDRREGENQARVVDLLVHETRRRTLVSILAGSYLVASGQQGAGSRLVLRLSAGECLGAIRQIATPEDLNEVVALWPLLSSTADRTLALTTIEMLTLQQFLVMPKGPRVVSTGLEMTSALQQVDSWVGSQCTSVDGVRLLRAALAGATTSTGRHMAGAEACLEFFKRSQPPAWPTLAAYLEAFGAPSVDLDRRRPDNPRNKETMRKVINRVEERFPISVRSESEPPHRPRERRPVR